MSTGFFRVCVCVCARVCLVYVLTRLRFTSAYKVSPAFSWQEKVGRGIESAPPGRQSVMARAADPLTSAEVICAAPKAPRPLKDHQSPQTLDTVFLHHVGLQCSRRTRSGQLFHMQMS